MPARSAGPCWAVFTMYSWRDQAYYQSDPWRGKWDTEGGGVLVNQSPHMLDLLIWLMDDQVAEVCGYWANLNHPYVEVEDSAVAILRFARGGLGSIVTSVSQKPGIHTKVHIHGSNGSSVGVETDRGATFIAGMTPSPSRHSMISGPSPAKSNCWSGSRPRIGPGSLWPSRSTTTTHCKFKTSSRRSFRIAPPEVTGEDGQRVVALIQAIYRSNQEKRPVRLAAEG